MHRGKKTYTIFLPPLGMMVLLLFFSCSTREDLTEQVDVFIGTGGEGHTWPGAALPFGMVQLSPDTRLHGQAACGGYYFPDSTLLGFSHTHLPGVGEPEYRDILFMPFTGPVHLHPGSPEHPEEGYRSAFSHSSEEASPGYYAVTLADHDIRAEMTVTPHCGMQRYTYPAGSTARVLIDLAYPGGAEELYLRKVSDTEIEGLRRSHGWAWDEWVYFVSRFSRPFDTFALAVDDTLRPGLYQARGKNLKAVITWADGGEQVLIKTGLSAVSTEGARRNLEAEMPAWAFDRIRSAARKAWQRQLSRITVQGGTPQQRRIFYTSMYHAFLSPYLYMDTDSLYRGIDHRVHRARGFTNYTVFSLWDTFRSLHPLFTILSPSLTNTFIRSLLAKYNDGGRLPMWPLAGNYTDDMIGYHAVSVIADAWMKGIRGYDGEKALLSMEQIADMNRLGLKYYKETGFVPDNRQGESVSKTLEYCYDDWCIAQMARTLGKDSVYTRFHRRAWTYRNVFDTTRLFMRPRLWDRRWREPFDPLSHHGFTEANAYQYLFVPHDVKGLIRLMGGDSTFTAWLDTLFTKEGKESGKAFIGQYNQGNEPSHHLAWLYNYAGRPWKTQERVHRIQQQCYTATPDGISGNDDAGQMSAWYIFGALGFYPVSPGLPVYVLGTPLFPMAALRLENGRTFIVEARNLSGKNFYICKVTLNGRPLTRSYLTHSEITGGGHLVFYMDSLPDRSWGTAPGDRPPTENGKEPVRRPYLSSGERLFMNNTILTLGCDTRDAEIRYTLDGTEPQKASPRYKKPFEINKSTVLKMRAWHPGLLPSATVHIPLRKAQPLPPVQVLHPATGIRYDYYERFFVTTSDLLKVKPLKSGIALNISLAEAERTTYFGLRFRGYVKVPATGIYTFYLASNDGSTLFIDGKEVIENDGNHAEIEEWGSVALQKGMHAIEVRYFQCGGGRSLKLSWKGYGFGKKELDELYYENDETMKR